jgi:hypothetical protein
MRIRSECLFETSRKRKTRHKYLVTQVSILRIWEATNSCLSL